MMSAAEILGRMADPDGTGGAIAVTPEWLVALGESLEELAADLAVLPQLAEDVATIMAKVAEYEPLIEMVKKRADRGSGWRKSRGGD